jgi:hypothetical protein
MDGDRRGFDPSSAPLYCPDLCLVRKRAGARGIKLRIERHSEQGTEAGVIREEKE